MMLEPFWPSPSSTVIHRGAPLESISVSPHPKPNIGLHWSSEGGHPPPPKVCLQPLESLLSLTVAQDLMKREITHQNQGWSAGVSATTLSTYLWTGLRAAHSCIKLSVDAARTPVERQPQDCGEGSVVVEHELLVQKTWVWVSVPTGWLTTNHL